MCCNMFELDGTHFLIWPKKAYLQIKYSVEIATLPIEISLSLGLISDQMFERYLHGVENLYDLYKTFAFSYVYKEWV